MGGKNKNKRVASPESVPFLPNHILNKLMKTWFRKAIQCSVVVNRVSIMCLSSGTPRTNKFSICSKWKINFLGVPKFEHITA